MSDEKTSPGPWRWDSGYLFDADSKMIAYPNTSDQVEVSEADAALIASAPTLRDQLARAVELLRRYVDAEFDEDPIAYEAKTFLTEVDKP